MSHIYIIINETNFWLCIQRTSRNQIKGIYSKRTGKFSKLLLFKEILVAVILDNKKNSSFNLIYIK